MKPIQKIFVIIGLGVIAYLLTHPPVRCEGPLNYTELYLWDEAIFTRYWIDVPNLLARVFAAAAITAACVIGVGLKAEADH